MNVLNEYREKLCECVKRIQLATDCSTVGLALKIKTSRSATVLSMSNPHLMQINHKDGRQTELAAVVSDGGLWY